MTRHSRMCQWEVERWLSKRMQMPCIMSVLNSLFSDLYHQPCFYLYASYLLFFTSRAKYHKLKYGTELNQGDMKPPSYDSGKSVALLLFILNHIDCCVHIPPVTGLLRLWRRHSCWILFGFIAFVTVSFPEQSQSAIVVLGVLYKYYLTKVWATNKFDQFIFKL